MSAKEIACDIFASRGLALIDAYNSEYHWGHDAYLKSEPITKDVEVRIYKGNGYANIVHRETVKNVHLDDAHNLAEGIYKRFVANATRLAELEKKAVNESGGTSLTDVEDAEMGELQRMRYVVKDELTLGYIFKAQPGLMGVLSGNKDGHDWKNGPVSIFGSEIRSATEADFETFRVKVPPDFVSDPSETLPEIDASLPASHEAHLAEFHADRAAGYTGSIYEWHKERFGTFW